MKDNISEHITYKEATYSQNAVRAGIDNTPNDVQLKAMKHLAKIIFEPVRKHINLPLSVKVFRCTELNALTPGASPVSQHCKGEAMDIDSDNSNRAIFDYIRKHLDFDKLIWEFGDDNAPAWVHVSCKESGNRKEVRRARKLNGVTVYDLMV